MRLEDTFDDKDLQSMPKIDGALLKRAINLFKNNESCAEDHVVSEMLRVLDEDVLALVLIYISEPTRQFYLSYAYFVFPQ